MQPENLDHLEYLGGSNELMKKLIGRDLGL